MDEYNMYICLMDGRFIDQLASGRNTTELSSSISSLVNKKKPP
jgi:hypothetical protein